jgi:hypothetical protein
MDYLKESPQGTNKASQRHRSVGGNKRGQKGVELSMTTHTGQDQTPTTTEQGIPQDLLPGARLRNGAVVLDVKAIPGNLFVVLARIEGVHPFVTWLAENADHTYWGHYRLGYGEAVADFRRRT